MFDSRDEGLSSCTYRRYDETLTIAVVQGANYLPARTALNSQSEEGIPGPHPSNWNIIR